MSEREPSSLTRRRVVFHGMVQGVFFRATTRDLACGRQVVGFVRNLPDGTVELEAEGDSAEVDRFIAAIRRHYERQITDIEQAMLEPLRDENDFRVRY